MCLIHRATFTRLIISQIARRKKERKKEMEKERQKERGRGREGGEGGRKTKNINKTWCGYFKK